MAAARVDYSFPLRLDGTSQRAAQTSYGVHVEQMIAQILLTTPGERVDLPQFGCGLRQLVFAPIGDSLVATLQHPGDPGTRSVARRRNRSPGHRRQRTESRGGARHRRGDGRLHPDREPDRPSRRRWRCCEHRRRPRQPRPPARRTGARQAGTGSTTSRWRAPTAATCACTSSIRHRYRDALGDSAGDDLRRRAGRGRRPSDRRDPGVVSRRRQVDPC